MSVVKPQDAASISCHFPPFIRQALVGAASAKDKSQGERITTINAITDQLAAQGWCRPRSDNSRSSEWFQGRQK